MRTSVAVALCLFGLTLAADDESTRKSRQISHPILPLVHGSHSVYSLTHQPHFPQIAHYTPPAVHSLLFPHSSFHSTGPQVFDHNSHQQLPVSSHYQHQEYSHGAPQTGFSSGRQNGFQLASSDDQNEQPEQYESNVSPSPPFRQSQPIESSYQPLNSPSQDNAEQNFPSGGPLSQNFQGSPDFGQSQTSGGPSEQSAYRPSPRLYGPSQASEHYPSVTTNSQASSQQPQNQQQTRTYYPGPFYQQNSSPAQGNQQGPAVPILSQSGEIRPDGSYQFEFHSADGIHRSEIGEMRPGHYRSDDGAYN